MLSLRDTTLGAVGGVQADVNEGNGIFLDNDSAFFIGLVDNTAANSITSVSLQEIGVDTISYTFDNVISFQSTAVPEQSTTIALCVIAGVFGVRARRKKKRSPNIL